MINPKPVMSPFWLSLWIFALAVGWLLPNHYRPWLAFHTDAWIALTLLTASIVVFFRSPNSIAGHRITVVVALLIVIPWIQHVFGLVPITGNAWIASIYLFGFFLSLLVGAHWEATTPSQFLDGLFSAVGIASILSVFLQLRQWLQLDGLEMWSMGGSALRPYANLGQANQLGTLLLWGVLAAAWGVVRKKISAWIALPTVLFLLFGIALTGSRAAWVAIVLLVSAGWLWRRFWRCQRLPWIVTALGIYFVICVVLLGWARDASLSEVVRTSSELRPLAWKIFIDAIRQRPLFGYGWNQSALAQVAVAIGHDAVHGVFSYSHNLFLDLLVWCGIPLGGAIIIALLFWFWQRFRTVRCAEDALLFLFVLVVANHAMLELPLYYAYILLPVGMVMGVLDTRLHGRPVIFLGRKSFFALLWAGGIILALIIQDYSRIEPNYQRLRLKWQKIEMMTPINPPDVILLTQWRDFIEYALYEPKGELSEKELEWMRNVTSLFPNAIFSHKLATTLALNHYPKEAALWLRRMCKMVPVSDCRAVKTIWEKQAEKNIEINSVPWPIEKN